MHHSHVMMRNALKTFRKEEHHMTSEIEILFIWFAVVVIITVICSVVQAYNTPEVREAREYNRALILAAQQPARRKARINRM